MELYLHVYMASWMCSDNRAVTVCIKRDATGNVRTVNIAVLQYVEASGVLCCSLCDRWLCVSPPPPCHWSLINSH